MVERSKIVYLLGSLLLLGIFAGAVGFGLATLSGVKPSPVQLSATQVSMISLKTDIPFETPSSSMTGIPPATTPEALRTTSTPQSTLAVLLPTSSPSEIIVRDGESLYPVCRRNCPGLWSLNDVPLSLSGYAQAVSRINGIPWNNGHPLVYTGQRLEMPPCPSP